MQRSEKNANEKEHVETCAAGGKWRFLRRRTLLCRILAASFLCGCFGVVMLFAIFHWPTVNVPVYYVVVRPAFIWFGALLPFLVVGVLGVRLRWFLCGCVLWFVAFATVEDVRPLIRFSSKRARVEFENAQMAFLSYMAEGTGEGGRVTVPLRIATWNVLAGKMGAEQAVERLARLDADIIFMQEFAYGNDVDMIEALEKSPHFKNYQLKHLRNSNAVLSRYALAQLPNGPLSEWRGSVWRVQVVPGGEITCINVHLAPVDLRTQMIRGLSWHALAEATLRTRLDIEALRDTIDLYSKEGSIVVAGDFNLPPSYNGLRIATRNLKDCFSASGYGWGKTAPAWLPLVRIDMVYVPRDAEVFYAAAELTQYSDHKIVIAEVVLPVTLKPKDTSEP